jgi:hypothetical protein
MPETFAPLSRSGGDFDRDRDLGETSTERFDRAAFARRALDLVCPDNTRVAICEGASRLRLESGRMWGRESRRSWGHEATWALLAVSPWSSRRAIALAVAELARKPRAYALDLLLDASAPDAVA